MFVGNKCVTRIRWCARGLHFWQWLSEVERTAWHTEYRRRLEADSEELLMRKKTTRLKSDPTNAILQNFSLTAIDQFWTLLVCTCHPFVVSRWMSSNLRQIRLIRTLTDGDWFRIEKKNRKTSQNEKPIKLDCPPRRNFALTHWTSGGKFANEFPIAEI